MNLGSLVLHNPVSYRDTGEDIATSLDYQPMSMQEGSLPSWRSLKLEPLPGYNYPRKASPYSGRERGGRRARTEIMCRGKL